ncbi:MAG: CBS domain-containing protein [Alphaproteobacteria bacterium]|nr:CBS domain-containing protein [Alphaproteobacteria bacterium]
MRAVDVMSINVCTAGPDTPINEIALKLCDRNISALPVVDTENRVVGIVSEGDLMRRIEFGTDRRSWWLDLFSSNETLAMDYVKTHGRTAKDVMTRPAIVVEESTELTDIARLLDARRIKRVPVVKDGKVVGIVSRADIVRGLIVAAKTWGKPRAVDDDRIRTAILDEIRRMPFSASNVNVIVDDGEVHLWGPVECEQERAALRVAAENARGAREVVDHMVNWRPSGYI